MAASPSAPKSRAVSPQAAPSPASLNTATPSKKSSLSSPSKLKKKGKNRSVSFALPALPFPLASFLHPLRSASTQWLVAPSILMVACLFRWAVGLGPYSGMASPPMHGDFEAQRHWMEITTQLPLKDWYWHDLEWWGLDYPPLTAYHSWLIGKIGNFINPAWFELYTSRTLDDYHLKVFMRATAIASEYFIYVPAVIWLVRDYGKHAEMSRYDQAIALAAILLQPALILIDHGHFQYNSVMLGFTLLAVCCFLRDRLLWGSFFFVLSLGFKQMGLYYSPVIFAYLLGLCVFPRINLPQLILIGAVTIATFTILLLPLIVTGGLPLLAQCLHRVFPFSRGLWEDKVANAWCALNVVIKFRQIFSTQTLQRLSLFATLTSILPPCAIIFMNPKKHLLPLALSACAWGFFLFSFQVHEKSVLLPLMPVTLLLAGGLDRDTVSWVNWINTIAMFSMSPLLKRDGLTMQYLVMTGIWTWLMGGKYRFPTNQISKLAQVGSYVAILGLHLAELIMEKPKRWPDLWVVGNVIVCCGAFVWMYLWTLRRLWTEKDAVGGKRKKE